MRKMQLPSDAPPPYDSGSTILTQASPFRVGAFIQQRSRSWSPLRTMVFWHRERRCAAVLARICDLVTAPNYTPSSAFNIVKKCAATLSVSEFSNLLQSPNIRGHTAMYWAITNDRREALSAIIGFIHTLLPASSDDLRLACMSTNDHALFIELGLELEHTDCTKGTPSCPLASPALWPDMGHTVTVHEGNYENQFIASVQFNSCQKYLYALESLSAEFIAMGHIWWLCIHYQRPNGNVYLEIGLSQLSIPACPEVTYSIKPKRMKPGSVNQPQERRGTYGLDDSDLLVPRGYKVNEPKKPYECIFFSLDECQLMNKNSAYIDSFGSLCVLVDVHMRR